MLIWVTALHCEAKPVIDYYHLRKTPGEQAFDVYRGDQMACVVSGSGKLASAAACAWIAAGFAGQPPPAWLNLGIAGAAEHEIGEACLLNKIVDADSGKRYYPAPLVPAQFAASSCLTLGRPGYDYRDDCLYDMEASGFMQAALYFSSAELVQGIKVVSDNRRRQCVDDRQQVSELIHGHVESLARQAEALNGLAEKQASLEAPQDSWRQLLSLAHFSQTQKNRLRVLWRYLSNRDFDPGLLLQALATETSAGSIIQALEQISYRDSEDL